MAEKLDTPKHKAYKFLTENDTAVIATVTKAGLPHGATISYLADNKLNLYFVTSVESKKYQNLINNRDVAITIYRDSESLKESIQLSGRAERVDNIDSEQKAMEILMRKAGDNVPVPFWILYNQNHSEELALVKITPYKMTMGSFSTCEDALKHSPYTLYKRHNICLPID